jgi:hypothetical protein
MSQLTLINLLHSSEKSASSFSQCFVFGNYGCYIWVRGQRRKKGFGNNKLDWLKKYFLFSGEIPTDDTISRIFQLVDPNQFQKCFVNGMKSCCEMTHGDVIAIDGKTLRNSFN